ncbi:hypothetical protein [Terracoccus luteus]|uniref:Uncharacterized protein n=1 Tax=Terracoccus luteus TaxID=53356 RepID=A0A839PV22_9MICO|nr:hypothetical protein [Terracoccus luteus]MBB2985875.1 hypothetical protein [Terracoccus luteus]MCP2171527.1 hypothetical protein [Terracoccus luteus]
MATDTPQGTDATEQPTPEHRRPDGVTDATVEALGKLSEALEVVEDARGHLYGFHRLSGQADLTLGEAVDLMRDSGDTELGVLADRLEEELVGRNVVQGRWTFQVVEEYDDGYYADFRRLEADARQRLVGGRRHLFEAEMKQDRRTHGRRGHEASPDDGGTQSFEGAEAGSPASTGDSQ